jgi:hypothetical protein
MIKHDWRQNYEAAHCLDCPHLNSNQYDPKNWAREHANETGHDVIVECRQFMIIGPDHG